MKRCVIVAAAKIENYQRIKSFLRPDDYFIFCDGGLSHAKALGVTPSLALGDFDSYEKPEPSGQTEVIVLPREKDDTDTFFAVKEGLRRGFKDFLLTGVTGQRLDHTMANFSALIYLYKNGAHALIIDDSAVYETAGKEGVKIEDDCSYFSLIPLTGTVSGVTIKGAAYPLENGQVGIDYIYTTSNEVLPGQTAFVKADEGLLLVIKGK
jgi:thiamine pyrophosphokinase